MIWLTRLWRTHFHAGRGGRVKLAVTSSLATRLVLTSVSVVVMPMTVRYLGNEGYGLMVIMSSVVGWLQFSSIGIGTALQSPLTEAYTSRDVGRQQALLSTAIAALVAIALTLLTVGAIVFSMVNWLSVFPPTTDRFVHEIPVAFLIVFLGFVGTIAVSFVGPLYAARQELHVASLPPLIAGLLTFSGTVLAIHLDLGLVGIVIAGVGLTSAVQLLFAIWTLYFRGQPELRPRWRHCSRTAWNSLFTRGVDFLLLQLCSIAFFQIDAFLIAHFLTTNDVTPYSVAQKAFLQLAGLFAIVSGSMWGAYGDARASGDVVWIRRARRTIERLFLVFYGGLAVVMVLFGHRLLGWWVGDAAAPGTLLIAAVAAYFCAREWTTLHAMLLNGLDVIRPQVWVLSVTAVLILVLNTIAVQTFGVIGLALGGLVGFSCLSAWYLPLLASRALPRIQRESAGSLTAWDRAPHVQSADAPTLG